MPLGAVADLRPELEPRPAAVVGQLDLVGGGLVEQSDAVTAERTALDTAATAFSEMGVEETSMSDIGARLGGSKSTIYSYFASKEELVAAVMQEAIMGRLQSLFNGFAAGVNRANCRTWS